MTHWECKYICIVKEEIQESKSEEAITAFTSQVLDSVSVFCSVLTVKG